MDHPGTQEAEELLSHISLFLGHVIVKDLGQFLVCCLEGIGGKLPVEDQDEFKDLGDVSLFRGALEKLGIFERKVIDLIIQQLLHLIQKSGEDFDSEEKVLLQFFSLVERGML